MGKQHRVDLDDFRVKHDSKINLNKIDTKAGNEFESKESARAELRDDVAGLKECQEVLYASGTDSLLIVFQGMDAAGKDSTIRHVMGAINPQGCRVHSFKAPNDQELEHHFLWRPMPFLPERGMISIFNRSYYEEVLVVRVHPEFLAQQRLPEYDSLDELWESRYDEIRDFEKLLVRNRTHVLKFYLHVSKDEQKERFLDRLQRPDKHWKFNSRDLDERKLWPEYQSAFETALSATSTKQAPWYVIPADSKWYARAVVADIISQTLEELNLQYPEVDQQEMANFDQYIRDLNNE